MNKQAYLILAHKNLWQLKKLLSAIDYEGHEIYVHLDRGAGFGYGDIKDVCSRSDVHFIRPRIRVVWGGLSVVKAEMALFKEAVKTPHSYYHLLSGMDLPVKRKEDIYNFFEAHPDRQFVNMWPDDTTLDSCRYYTLLPDGSHFHLTDNLNKLIKSCLRKRGITINDGVVFKKGSQWLSLSGSFAEYLVEHQEWVKKVFSHCTLCDEIFIPTVLEQSPFKGTLYCPGVDGEGNSAKTNLRYALWERGNMRHPGTFTIGDYGFLVNSEFFWARKFDENKDREIIEKICALND